MLSVPHMARIYPTHVPWAFQDIALSIATILLFSSSLYNNWSKVVLSMCTRNTISSSTSSHFPDQTGRAWLAAIFIILGFATLVHGLHYTVGTPQTLHRRLFQVPHCTLRLSHLSVGGNARGVEIVGQLDM